MKFNFAEIIKQEVPELSEEKISVIAGRCNSIFKSNIIRILEYLKSDEHELKSDELQARDKMLNIKIETLKETYNYVEITEEQE